MFKELQENMMTMNYQSLIKIEILVSLKTEIIKNNQIEIVKLKSTMTEMSISPK